MQGKGFTANAAVAVCVHSKYKITEHIHKLCVVISKMTPWWKKINPIHSSLAFCANTLLSSSFVENTVSDQKAFAFPDASEILNSNLTSSKESISGIADYCVTACHLNSPWRETGICLVHAKGHSVYCKNCPKDRKDLLQYLLCTSLSLERKSDKGQLTRFI